MEETQNGKTCMQYMLHVQKYKITECKFIWYKERLADQQSKTQRLFIYCQKCRIGSKSSCLSSWNQMVFDICASND